MSYTEFIANSNTAFGGGQFELALDYAKKAISEKPKETDGYYCAGKACMSLGDMSGASGYFAKAVEIQPNGNGYFLLGYAQAGADMLSDSLRSLTRAVENGCDPSLKGQVYKITAMINTQQREYKNALRNLKQAEAAAGPDYEILQERAACYTAMRDFKNAVYTLNQMKLLKPDEYKAYSLSFHIFMDTQIYDEALAELDRAAKYADVDINYYNDRIYYALLRDAEKVPLEDAPDRIKEGISAVDAALKKGKPNAGQAFELYIRSANLYINLKDPDNAIRCLDASVDAVASFNEGFSVLPKTTQKIPVTADIPEGLSEDEMDEYMQERWDNGDFEELEESISEALEDIDIDDDPEEVSSAVQEFLSPTEKLSNADDDKAQEGYIISDDLKLNSLQQDMQSSLYIAAYEMKEDYANMLSYARQLQSSDIKENQYAGIYYELKYGKYTDAENWKKKYDERIKFWTRRMLEDPTDYVSASYRVRAYLDIGDVENAQIVCSCLPSDVQKPLEREIEKIKKQGAD